MMGIENVIDEIARYLDKDPLTCGNSTSTENVTGT